MTRAILLGLAGAVLVHWPSLAVPVGIGGLVWWARRRLLQPRRQWAEARASLATLARLLLIGLNAGLPLRSAMELALPDLHPLLAAEVSSVLRRAQQVGMAPALAGAPAVVRPLATQLFRAHWSGAPQAGGVAAFIEEERRRNRAAALEQARRLPVVLMVPLALLILPGFVLLTAGPSFVATLDRLLGPVLGH